MLGNNFQHIQQSESTLTHTHTTPIHEHAEFISQLHISSLTAAFSEYEQKKLPVLNSKGFQYFNINSSQYFGSQEL